MPEKDIEKPKDKEKEKDKDTDKAKDKAEIKDKSTDKVKEKEKEKYTVKAKEKQEKVKEKTDKEPEKGAKAEKSKEKNDKAKEKEAEKPKEGQVQVDEAQKLIQMAQISLALDRFDDIFSDFDPRPYTKRGLSDDFLAEAKKAAKEKDSGIIELFISMPADKRDLQTEVVIKKRLREHFKSQFIKIEKDINTIKRHGAILVFFGIIFMMIATYLYTFESRHLTLNMLIVVFEPAGWFMTWFGLDHIIYMAKDKKSDLNFYQRMSKCKITFDSY